MKEAFTAMVAFSFQAVEQSHLYIASDTSAETARAGFLLPASFSVPPAEISLVESLQEYHEGVYLFFSTLPYSPQQPGLLAGFLQALYEYLASTGLPDTRFVWLDNPADFASGLRGTTLQTLLEDNRVTTVRSTAITLAPNLALRITGGATITASSDRTTLTFAAEAKAPLALLATPQGSQHQVTIPLQKNTLEVGMLGGTVPEGCFRLDLRLDMNELSALDVGLRYFAPYFNADIPGYVQSFHYPLFNLTSGEAISFSATFDPLAALDPVRSYLHFRPDQDIPSFFSSVLNSPVIVSPETSAQLVFAIKLTTRPGETAEEDAASQQPYYLTPVGDFRLTIVGETPAPLESPPNVLNCLACGFSGIEYFPLPQGKGMITFLAGQNAYSPAQLQPAPNNPTNQTLVYKGLTSTATTSWAYLRSAENAVGYYAQPENAVLHQTNAPHSNVSADFLTYLPILAGSLPKTAPAGQVFPLVPYEGVSTDPLITTLEPYQQFENQVLNPQRRNLIYTYSPHLEKKCHAQTQSITQGTTPQGLLLTLEDMSWEQLLLAQSADSSQNGAQLLLSQVRGSLQAALQSNQLFLVISSLTRFLENCAIPNYRLTIQSITDLEQSQNPAVPAPVIATLWNAATLQNIPYTSLQDFQEALKPVLGPDYDTYVDIVTRVATSFTISIQEWRFDLSPYFWDDFNTLLIFKFINSKLQDLVQDSTSWVQAESLNDDVNSTKQQLQALVAAALADSSPEMDYFNTTVLGDPSWNGILALRCRVPLSSLPAQIAGIAAGINANQFFAHHMGITVTPAVVKAGTITAGNSSLFALIRYEDSADLKDQHTDYNFKVLSLKALFANSCMSSFSSKIELQINKLFLEPVSLQNGPVGNILTLDGVYQKHGNQNAYVFTTTSDHRYQVNSQVLDVVDITRSQFVTIVPPAGLQTGANIQARFLFWGNMQFKALSDFDAFSFGSSAQETGGLSYSSLAIDLQFPPDQPYRKTFTFNAQQIVFDPSTSVAHPDSLYNHFPLKLTGLVQATAEMTPANLGYMPVDSPLQGSQLTAPWFGLTYDLNLGSLGALAGQAGFVAGLLVGWAPNPHNYTVYIGLRIPGVSGGKREISLEGIVKLTFGAVRFVVRAPSYILQLRNISLHLLSLTFPPGQTDFILFGNPDGKDNTTLGWYAAYKKATQKKAALTQVAASRRSRKN